MAGPEIQLLSHKHPRPLPRLRPPPVHVNFEQRQPRIDAVPLPLEGPVRPCCADGLFVLSGVGGAFVQGFTRRRKVGYEKNRF